MNIETPEERFEKLLDMIASLVVVIINFYHKEVPDELSVDYKAGYLCSKLAEKLSRSL